MSSRRLSRLSKLSALSFSLPDVSEVGYSPSPAYYHQTQGILEESEEMEEDEKDGRSGYDMEESVREGEEERERWKDNVNPVTGHVFFVDSASLPHPHPNGSVHFPPSTSSSSLSSSTTSLSHPPLPQSLTSSPRPRRSSSFSASLPPTPNDSFFPSFAGPPPPPSYRSVTPSHSLYSADLPSPTHSEEFFGLFESDNFSRGVVLAEDSPYCPSPCPSEGWISKSVSVGGVVSHGKGGRIKRWRKMVTGKGGGKGRFRSYSQGLMPSDSVPNLACESNYTRRTPSSVPPSPPHGELFGSQEFPLEVANGDIISVRISLKPHPQGGRPHRHWNLEKLGIIPARSLGGKRYRSFTNLKHAFKNHYPRGHSSSSFYSSSSSSSSSSNSLVVRGIIPGTPASLASQLQQGDTILAVNGHGVNLENANSILRSKSSDEEELVLIVKKKTHNISTLTSTPAHHHLLTSSRHGNLIRLISGKQRSHRTTLTHPHLFLHLTLNTKEDDPADKDILYCYPSSAMRSGEGGGGGGGGGEKEGVREILMRLRGVFVTLSDVMGSISSSHLSCSTVLVDGELFHCAHIQRGKEVVLLILPASLLPRHLTLSSALNIEHILFLLQGHSQRIYSEEDDEDYCTADHVMSLLFHHLSPPSSSSSHPPRSHPFTISPLTSLTAVHREPFPVETVVRVNETLDELETISPHHQLSDNTTYSPPMFLPRGSALFHNGQLVVSHLPAEELEDVVRFCESYRLMEVSSFEPDSSIVIWREIHLHRHIDSEDENRAKTNERIFLLLVGRHRILVGLVMEGCGLDPEATPTLDPEYVSEAKQLISQLDQQNMFDNSSNFRGSMTKPHIPPVMSLDRVAAHHLSTPHQSHHKHQQRRRVSERGFRTKPQPSSSSSVAAGSDSEDENVPPSLGPRSMTLPSLRPRSKKTSEDSLVLFQTPTPPTLRQNFTLTAGNENILLHYLSLDSGQGVWLGPAHHTSSTYGTLHSEMIGCFHTTCAAIRNILLTKTDEDMEEDDEDDWGSDEEESIVKEEMPQTTPSSSSSSSPSWPPLSGGQCLEHGVLLEVPLKNFVTDKQLKNVPPLLYWIIGRIFPETEQELYVCYEENVSQTMVEMAFKLLFAATTTT